MLVLLGLPSGCPCRPMVRSVLISLREGFFLKLSYPSSIRSTLGGERLPLVISLSWMRPSLVVQSRAWNQSVRLSFLKRRLWLMQNLRSQALGGQGLSSTCYPKISLSIQKLKCTSNYRISNSFSLSNTFSFTATDSSLQFLSSRKAYLSVSSSLLAARRGRKTSKLPLVDELFSPTLFFSCSLTRPTSASFFLTSCRACSFLALSPAMILRSSSLSLRTCASPFFPLVRNPNNSFSSIPTFRRYSSAVRWACYAKLRNLSRSNCSAAWSSLTLLRKSRSFCLCATSSSRQRRVSQLSRLKGISPMVIPHPLSTLFAKARCYWNCPYCGTCECENEDMRESQRVSASWIQDRCSAKKGCSINLNIIPADEREGRGRGGDTAKWYDG